MGRRVSTAVPVLTPGVAKRRLPKQARSIETYELILSTAQLVLVRDGYAAFTTISIAKEAAINVATIYQYFTDKQAILVAMFERLNQEREGVTSSMVDAMRSGVHWSDAIDAAISTVVEIRRRQPGIGTLRLAMRSDPSLAMLDRRFRQSNARIIATALVEVAGLDQATADIVSRCALEAHASLLDMWLFDYDQQEERIVEETRLMVRSYLAHYFGKSKVKLARKPDSGAPSGRAT